MNQSATLSAGLWYLKEKPMTSGRIPKTARAERDLRHGWCQRLPSHAGIQKGSPDAGVRVDGARSLPHPTSALHLSALTLFLSSEKGGCHVGNQGKSQSSQEIKEEDVLGAAECEC